MPAETHRHAATVTTADVHDLLSAVTGVDDVDLDATLSSIGFVDELDIFSFWDAVVEEHAERCVGDSDLTELLEAVTVRDLIVNAVSLLDGSSRMA